MSEEAKPKKGTEMVPKESVSEFFEKVEVGPMGVRLQSMDDMRRFAQAVVKSGLAPKGDSPEAVMVKLQAGAELGIAPMRALSGLTAINGRIGVMGDLARALIRRAGVLKDGTDFKYTVNEKGATVHAWRKGMDEPCSGSFTVEQAKRARLWGKPGPWSDYPQRQLKYRALGFLVRDHFSDVLMGMAVSEEIRDFPPEVSRVFPGDSPSDPPEAPKEPDPLLATPVEQKENE